ncbi:hypothetical protein NECAME_15472 [Necator americanus]|uniref:Uncharacterized protein n=1 Tax=Necator americanus TaxID=51031 RepID=W2SHY5_NECAM|nr:hypothetical protein NECAME_15472 [Necator americanus]ETN69183.1 hypothetical protein NECAME_15472 [Necator americanus]
MENPRKESVDRLVSEITVTHHQDIVVERKDNCSRELIHDKKLSPIPVALVHPLPSSPTGVWVRKQPRRKYGCVMFHDIHPSSSKQEERKEELPLDVDSKVAIERIIEELLKETLSSSDDDVSKDIRKEVHAQENHVTHHLHPSGNSCLAES